MFYGMASIKLVLLLDKTIQCLHVLYYAVCSVF